METQAIKMERAEAARLYRKYREHRAWSQPIDEEIQRIYRHIAKGKVVIRALDSIRAAGLGHDGYPKLAIMRADMEECFLRMASDGSATMTAERWIKGRTAASKRFRFPPGTFVPTRRNHFNIVSAIVPHIPPDIRPQRGLANYHILWEAEWSPVPPVDPILLRRIGKGDVWLVCGAWNLTEVERAVMADRMRARQ